MTATSSVTSPRPNPFAKLTKDTQATLLSFILPYIGMEKVADVAKTCKLWNTLVCNGDITLVDFHFSYSSDTPREKQALVLKLFKICSLTLQSDEELEEVEWGLYNRHPIRCLQIESSNFRFTVCRPFFDLQTLTLHELSLDETLRAPSDFSLSRLRSLCLIQCAVPPAPLRQLFLGCSSIRQLEFRCCSLTTMSYKNATFALLPHLSAIRWDENNDISGKWRSCMPWARLEEMLCGAMSFRSLLIDVRDAVPLPFFNGFSCLQSLALANLTLSSGSALPLGLPNLRSLRFTQCTLPAVPLDQFFRAAASVTSLSVRHCKLISDSGGNAVTFSTLSQLHHVEWRAPPLSLDMTFVQLRRMLIGSTSLQKLSLVECDMATDKVLPHSIRSPVVDFTRIKMPTLEHLQMTDCTDLGYCDFAASNLHTPSCTLSYALTLRETITLPQFCPTLIQLTLQTTHCSFDLTKDLEKIRQCAPKLKKLTLENFRVMASENKNRSRLPFPPSLTTLRFLACFDVHATKHGLHVGFEPNGQIIPSQVLPSEVILENPILR